MILAVSQLCLILWKTEGLSGIAGSDLNNSSCTDYSFQMINGVDS